MKSRYDSQSEVEICYIATHKTQNARIGCISEHNFRVYRGAYVVQRSRAIAKEISRNRAFVIKRLDCTLYSTSSTKYEVLWRTK